MKKKLLSLTLSLVLSFSLCSCDKDNSNSSGNENSSSITVQNSTTTEDVSTTTEDVTSTAETLSVTESSTTTPKVTTPKVTTTKVTTSESSDSSENANTESNNTTVTPQMPKWAENAVIYEVNVRQYTKEGTFNAFAKSLPRLKEMGITTLWFMPIHPISQEGRKGVLGSYYSIKDYTSVNPEFGTMEDFKNLVNQCHSMGFTVMLDWVANHTGWDNAWVNQHYKWYAHNSDGDYLYPYDWTDVAQLNYNNYQLRAEMIKSMKFWVEKVDVDGFRCDYAGGVPTSFWETARTELSQTKQIYMLAEDSSNMSLLKTAFDSNYNWDLYGNLKSVAKGQLSPSYLKSKINRIQDLPAGKFPLNFIENHDENSWGGTLNELFGETTIPALTTLIFTIPGAPLVYSGQEAGSNKSLKFFEKDEIDWSNMRYENIITALTKIKQKNPALYNGSAGGKLTFLGNTSNNVIAFERVKGNNRVTVILCLSGSKQNSNITYGNLKNAKIVLRGKGSEATNTTEKSISSNELSSLNSFEPWEYIVITSTVN